MIVFIIPNFVKFVPQICVLLCVNIIGVLKQIILKIPFIINRNLKNLEACPLRTLLVKLKEHCGKHHVRKAVLTPK